jgi:hypothetical protein
MPITDPLECRDRSVDWTAYFYHRRGAEIARMIDDELIAEHERNADQSQGHHSANLHFVLNYFRGAPIIGKEFVYVVTPLEDYRIGLVTARGTAAQILDETKYTSEQDAVHAVFMARVKKLRDSLGNPQNGDFAK